MLKHNQKEKWIVDTDPGCDDMMAILYLLKRSDVDLLMISLVDGNVSLENVSINSRKILKLAGKTIPLHCGASNPIVKYFENIESYHYTDGLGDIEEIKTYDVNDIRIEEENSVVKLLEYVNTFPGEINLLCLGPLTNIAIAFMLNPNLQLKLKKVFMMGGSTRSEGNLLPPCEFNFAYDFIASKIIISEFRNVVLTPWEPTAGLMVRDQTIITFSENIKMKNKKLNEILFYFVSMIIAKFTADKNGTQLCDLYSVITAFRRDAVIKFSIIKCDVIIDSMGMLGMLYIKGRRVLKESFEGHLEKIDGEEKGSHIVIEELDQIKILDEYEEIFSM